VWLQLMMRRSTPTPLPLRVKAGHPWSTWVELQQQDLYAWSDEAVTVCTAAQMSWKCVVHNCMSCCAEVWGFCSQATGPPRPASCMHRGTSAAGVGCLGSHV
jgi:hypothetical protein